MTVVLAPPTTFSDEAWRRVATTRAAIDRLPFLVELRDGTLPRETFEEYLAQDAHYLVRYASTLSSAAARADDPEDVTFWATSATTAVQVERSLHAAHVADLDAVEASPTCLAYTSWLLSLAAVGSYAELVAGVLPCFWVYQDVGARLLEGVDTASHPYGDWIATYGAPEFLTSTRAAVAIVDRVASTADAATVARMHAAFARGVQYEWMFWDAAHRHETWPV